MRKTAYLVLFSCLFLLQSCFEIIEELVIRNDGSGNFRLLVNMSKSRTRLNSIMKMKTVNGHKVPDKAEISKEINEIEKTVSATPGIKDVKTSVDFDNFIVSLSCNFTKAENLNTAVKSIAVKEGSSNQATDKIYEFDPGSKTLSRINKFLLKDEYQKMSSADKEIFANANYTSIFRFDSDVAAVSNKESKISANKRAVMTRLSALDLVTHRKSIENKINLVK